MKNIYVIQKVSEMSENTIRGIWIEDDEGLKHVKDIFEMKYEGTRESLKNTIKILCDMMFVGEDGEYEIYASNDANSKMEYEPSLEGKARKRISKEINVLTAQLFG
jgi:hypothetical protein